VEVVELRVGNINGEFEEAINKPKQENAQVIAV